ncbi:MAG: hypothetical protein C0594_06865 [Marinilabiliales bacterium]|nr:MAG: hypothetical protein C0594_06865 [Marinilabiliales bacterium]
MNAGFTKLYGYEFDEFKEFVGKNMFECTSYPELQNLIDKCKETKESVVYASLNKRKDGTSLWIQTTLTPIFDDVGEIKQYVAIDSDITTLKEQEEEIKKRTQEIIVHRDQLKEALNKLSELEGFKESMTGMIVHDLKNHLNSIIAFSSQMVSENNLKRIHQAGKQMLNMVLNILDVQKFEKTEVKLETNIHNVQIVVKNALDDVSLLIDEKSIHVENKITSHVQSKFDYDIILRVLVNILTNAIKYTPSNGRIILDYDKTKEDSKEMVVVSVRDTGQGIPKDMIAKIFDKFSQVEAKKSGMARSTGLGLSFCKMVVEAHTGKIWADSELGEGTTFFFSLPLVNTEKEHDAEEVELVEEIKEDMDVDELTHEEKEILKPYVEKLLSSDISEFSFNLTVIDEIKSLKLESEAFMHWLNKLEAAFYNLNAKASDELLNKCKN